RNHYKVRQVKSDQTALPHIHRRVFDYHHFWFEWMTSVSVSHFSRLTLLYGHGHHAHILHLDHSFFQRYVSSFLLVPHTYRVLLILLIIVMLEQVTSNFHLESS